MCGTIEPVTPVIPENAVSLRTVQVRVNKSAKRLDKKVKGWFEKISAKSLDMHMPQHCIVGQLRRAGIVISDSDMDEKLAYYLNAEYPVTHKGKVIVERYSYANGHSHSTLLTRLWTHQINKRLKAKAKKKPRKVASKPSFHGC
jgi:hypothetical protein